MSNYSLTVRFSAADGKADLATSVQVLSNLQRVLNASLRRAATRERLTSLAHSAVEDAGEEPSLRMRLNAVEQGSVLFGIDLGAFGLFDPFSWLATLGSFFQLVTPNMVDGGREFVVQLVTTGIASTLNDKFKERSSDFSSEEDLRGSVLATGTTKGEAYLNAYKSLLGSTDGADEDEFESEEVNVQLLEDFLTDPDIMNGVAQINDALRDTGEGLDFSVRIGEAEVYRFEGGDEGSSAAPSEPKTLRFADMPMVFIWRPDCLDRDSGAASLPCALPENGKVEVVHEEAKRQVGLNIEAIAASWGTPVEDIPPGSEVEALVSGESLYNRAQRRYSYRNLVVDEILAVRER